MPNERIKKAEVDNGQRPGIPTEIAERMKVLEQENLELRQANEILRNASAYFAMTEFTGDLIYWDLIYWMVDAGTEPPADSAGDSYDNALAETINGLFKAEMIHRRSPWRSIEAVEYATLEWADWFNNRRLLEWRRN